MKRRMALIVMAALFLTGCGSTGTPQAAAPAVPGGAAAEAAGRQTIVVESREEVKVVPDMAVIRFGVDSEAKEADECVSLNSQEVSQVVEQLKGFGIEETSIQTADVRLDSRYSYANDTQTLTGYTMHTSIVVSGVGADRVGEVLSKSVAAGINNIESIVFQAGSYDESYQAALKQAVEAAAKKAELLAAAGGCTLGEVVAIQEHPADNSAEYSRGIYNYAKEAALEDAAAVMPGEVSITASVTVEYRIQ